MSDTDNLTVTGIVTTYKREAHFVERAVRSMINQTYPLFEIIVIDDNVDDSEYSAQILQMLSSLESDVMYIKQDGNKGACAARNLGILNAKGHFIGFLDDDDVWLPQKIERQIRCFMSNNESVGLVYCTGINRYEDTGREEPYYNFEGFRETVTHEDLLYRDYVASTSQPLIRKEVFYNVGMFWEEQPARQDYEMWLRISQKYDIKGIKESLFIHTIHGNEQISRSPVNKRRGLVNIYKRYKKEYDRHPLARKTLARKIILFREGSSFIETGYYCFLWLISKIQCRD